MQGAIRTLANHELRTFNRNTGHMQPTLLALCILPPPSAGADVLTRRHGARAACAADAWVELVMQFIVRHIVLLDVFPYLCIGPVQQRIEFLQTMVRIKG